MSSWVRSKAHDILVFEKQEQGIISHNWIHYSTPSYKLSLLSLLSLQEKSFTSQWPRSALNPQRNIPNCESTEMSPGRIKRERVTIELSQEWVKWPKAYRKLYDGNEKTTIRSHQPRVSLYGKERKKRCISSNVCTVRLIYLMNALLSFV